MSSKRTKRTPAASDNTDTNAHTVPTSVGQQILDGGAYPVTVGNEPSDQPGTVVLQQPLVAGEHGPVLRLMLTDATGAHHNARVQWANVTKQPAAERSLLSFRPLADIADQDMSEWDLQTCIDSGRVAVVVGLTRQERSALGPLAFTF